jgi:O-methyltransferase
MIIDILAKFLSNRKLVWKAIYTIIKHRKGDISFYDQPVRTEVYDLVKKIKKEREMLLSINDAYQIFMAVKRTDKIIGDIAEVGVYKGGSAKLICEIKGEKLLHLFDTFEGLCDVGEIDNVFYKGQFVSSYDNVKNCLKNYPNVYIYKGLFPATGEPIKHRFFSFVNLDVDTYESTLNCLNFFYERMSKGGIIISHDYLTAGVKKAFDEFIQDKREPIIDLAGSQCLIVKI